MEFAGGAHEQVDVLVGADGIHSRVRGLLFGPERPRFTGCIAYRGLVPAERLRALELEVTAQVWLGPGRHFVHYFVSGRRLVNFVAIVEQGAWTRESWTDRGEVSDALAAFAGWHPQVRQIIGAVDEAYVWALFDRVPLERWSAGRVTLLGDACHAMLPFMAQGAAQAIEDGATLAACLDDAGNGTGADPAEALRRYERLRVPRTSRIHAASTRQQDTLSPPRRPGAAGARRPDVRRSRRTGPSRPSRGSTSTTPRTSALRPDVWVTPTLRAPGLAPAPPRRVGSVHGDLGTRGDPPGGGHPLARAVEPGGRLGTPGAAAAVSE